MLISIVIPVLDDPRVVSCVQSIYASCEINESQIEILVVDNGLAETVRLQLSNLNLVSLRIVREHRPGEPLARNKGIQESRGNLILFVDADCTVGDNWIMHLIEPFRDPSVWLVAGQIQKSVSCSSFQKAARSLDSQLEPAYLPILPLPYVVTANCAYRKEVFEVVGGFDENFLISGCDVDMAYRAQLAGGKLVLARDAVVYHPARATLGAYFRQFYGYALGHAQLWRKYSSHRGRVFAMNTYPFVGLAKIAFVRLPELVIRTLLRNEAKEATLQLFLDLTEFVALICGDLVGSIRFRCLFV